MVDRRKLTVGLMLLAATGQAVSGFAPNFATLAVGIAVAGVFSVAAQVLIPFAASLAEPERSGQVVGTIMSGLLIGILLARSVAGVLSGLGGWSTVYKVAAVLMVVMAVALWRSLPSDSADRPKASYRATLASVGKLAATLPRLRTRSAMGGLAFAAVSTVFTTMAFLLSGEFGYSDTQIGLVGLLGVAGALMATVAGRLADRGLGQLATGGAIAILLVSWLPFVAGATHVVWFLVAIVLADLALQGVHVSNQNVIYAPCPRSAFACEFRVHDHLLRRCCRGLGGGVSGVEVVRLERSMHRRVGLLRCKRRWCGCMIADWRRLNCESRNPLLQWGRHPHLLGSSTFQISAPSTRILPTRSG